MGVAIARQTQGEVVAIDGKSLCGTRAGKKSLVHMVSAWASANNLVLGQRKIDAKSNEITAIPELLRVLELSGTMVTIDAMGCQKPIARQIVGQKGITYWRSRRTNPHLLADLKDSFKMLPAVDVDEQIDCGHGRVERRCSVLGDLSLVDNRKMGLVARSCASRPRAITRPPANANTRRATTSPAWSPTPRG